MTTPQTNPYSATPEKKKKSHKLAWIAGIGAVVVVAGASMNSDGDSDNDTAVADAEPTSVVAVADADTGSDTDTDSTPITEDQATTNAQTTEDVPREYKNALRSAESYLRISGFSQQGLYDQLTSEYADQYSAEAAQYAIDNVDADYFQEAVESAENYLEFMPMSGPELFDQLTSEYGEKFTAEEAQHAVAEVGL